MKLYSNPASPFARKARIIVFELNLDSRVAVIDVDTSAMPDEVKAVNPLGKIPALVLDDGSALFDSKVICEYLNETGGGKFFPGMSIWRPVSGRWRALTLAALGDGICEAAIGCVLEGRRPAEQQSPAMVEKHLAAVNRALDVLERAKFQDNPTIGEISVGSALGYLDFRLPELGWRQTRPNLRDWYEKFAQYPSMKATWPKALERNPKSV